MKTMSRRTEQRTRWWRGPRVGLGAMVGAILLVVAACGGDDESASTQGTTSTTTSVATTTTVSATTTSVTALGSDEALSVTDAYFEAYNAGDVEAVLALFEPDATFSDNFGSQTRTDWEQLLVFNAAQGTTLSPPECTVTADSGVVDSVTVSCPHSNLDALVQAVDGPPVPIKLTLTITPDGISQWHSIFGQPNFNNVGNPFDIWMKVNHPEDLEAVGFGNWTTVEEAKQSGILNARYADEWATYLEANGCTYRDGC